MKMNSEPKNVRKPSERNDKRINTMDSLVESTTNLVKKVAKIEETQNYLLLEVEALKKELWERYAKEMAISNKKSKNNCKCKKSNCVKKTCHCVRQNKKCNSLCECTHETCQNKEVKPDQNNKEQNDNDMPNKSIKVGEKLLDPMKPRHELPRTPPKKDSKKKHNKSESQPHEQLSIEKLKIESSNTQGIEEVEKVEKVEKEEEVIWEQHTAQLVPCKKCKRTFMPDRIEKHEACCKKL